MQLTFYKKLNLNVHCGEYKLIDASVKDNYKSKTNRRVELLFFDLDENPAYPCLSSQCDPQECSYGNPQAYISGDFSRS